MIYTWYVYIVFTIPVTYQLGENFLENLALFGKIFFENLTKGVPCPMDSWTDSWSETSILDVGLLLLINTVDKCSMKFDADQ